MAHGTGGFFAVAKSLLVFPLRLTLDVMNRRSNIYRALAINPGSAVCLDGQRFYSRDLEVPSGDAVGTARAIAQAYSVFGTGGRELGLRQETLDLLAAPAIPRLRGFYDECLKAEVKFSLGFIKPSRVWPFGSPSSFGSPGAGGSLGFADPKGWHRLCVCDESDRDSADRGRMWRSETHSPLGLRLRQARWRFQPRRSVVNCSPWLVLCFATG
jgi:hypothetical protein